MPKKRSVRALKTISVLGETYRFKRVSGLIESEKLEGYVSPHEYTICIDSSLKGRVFKRVLLHEICHAWLIECGLHETMGHQALEMVCQSFSALVSQLKF